MHIAKRSTAYLLFLRSCRQFCERDDALSPTSPYPPPPTLPWMHTPLNYLFSILCSGKALRDVTDYVNDSISQSYEIGTIPVFTQTSLTYMYRERIINHGHAYESIDAQSFAEAAHATQFREKILNKIQGLSVAKRGRQVAFTVDDEVG